jgi:hypothetical protein
LDGSDANVHDDEIIRWFHSRFHKKTKLKKEDADVLQQILFPILWSMFHEPQCFDELLESRQ